MKKSQISKLDKLFSQIICRRDGHKCVICRNTETIQTHHWYRGKKRGGYATRWMLENGICVCAGCHLQAHQSVVEFMRRFEAVKSREWFEEMEYKIDMTLRSTFKVDYEGVSEFLEGLDLELTKAIKEME